MHTFERTYGPVVSSMGSEKKEGNYIRRFMFHFIAGALIKIDIQKVHSSDSILVLTAKEWSIF